MILRNPLRPFPKFPGAPGQWYSPLDFRADAAGVPLVERAFADCAALRSLAGALGQLVGDDERGQLAMKKMLHAAFEDRLRALAVAADPPESYGLGPLDLPPTRHPLDTSLAGELGITVSRASWNDRLWHRVELTALAAAVVGRAVWIWIRFGKFRVNPRVCRLLALNAWPESRWVAIADALARNAYFAANEMLAEVNATTHQGLTIPQTVSSSSAQAAPTSTLVNRIWRNWKSTRVTLRRFENIPTIFPPELPVSVWSWLRDAIVGSARLAVRALVVGFGGGGDARVVEGAIQALRVANRALDARRLTSAVRFDTCVDNMEYDPRHILIGALAPTAKIVRLPHSEMDTPGVGLSYLGYDLFLSGGTYQADTFGHTWRNGTQASAVGILQNHNEPVHVSLDYQATIAAELNKGRKLAVVFGPSGVESVWPPFLELLDIILDIFEGRKDWLVVVKPKGSDKLYEEADRNPALARKLRDGHVMCMRYPHPGREVYPAVRLIEQMELGICSGGTVLLEALCRNRMVMAYFPVVGETPLNRHLIDLGILHTTRESFCATMQTFVDGPRTQAIPFVWFRERFDPFGDDRTFDRIAEILYPRYKPAESSLLVRANS